MIEPSPPWAQKNVPDRTHIGAASLVSVAALARVRSLADDREMGSLTGVPDPAERLRSAGPSSILLIEDDFAIRRTLALVLMDEGFDVICTADGREALSVLAESGGRPALIILDLWMPSMDGLEFRILQQSYARWADVPVLVITASRFLPRELQPLGLTHVLRKPLDYDELLAKIEQLTRQKSPG